jgi:hypothetical protein
LEAGINTMLQIATKLAKKMKKTSHAQLLEDNNESRDAYAV